MTERLVDSGIALDHARTWSVPEAIRELLQNYVDVINEFGVQGAVTWENGIARIHDFGPGLEMRHFAFGYNNKASGSIGQFGEGMKSGLLTLLRNNRKVIINSRRFSLRPALEISKNFEIETLHYIISDNDFVEGTEIIVECTEEELQRAKQYFVAFLNVEWVEKDKISLPGGYIYVNGSQVGKLTNAVYSYHLEGEDAQKLVNRDRDAVDINYAKGLIQNIINGATSDEVKMTIFKECMAMQNNGLLHYEASLYLRPDYDSRYRWLELWNKLYGEKYVVSGDEDADRVATYRGYTVLTKLPYTQASFLQYIGIPTAYIIAKQSQIDGDHYELEDLEEFEQENFNKALRLIAKYYYVPLKSNILIADMSSSTGGEYNHVTGVITIARYRLNSFKGTMSVLLHEIAHWRSGKGDCTAGFEEELLNMAATFMGFLEQNENQIA